MAKRNSAQRALENLQDYEFGDSGLSISEVLRTFFKEAFRSSWTAGVADEYDEDGYVEVNEGDCLVQFEAPIDDTGYRFVWVVDQEGSYGLVYLCVDDEILDEDEAAELMETFGQQYHVAKGGSSSRSKSKRKRSSDDDDGNFQSHLNLGNAGSSGNSSQYDEDDEDYDEDDDEDEDEDDEDCDEDCDDCDEDDEDWDEDDEDCDDCDEDDEDWDEDDEDDEDDDDCCCNRRNSCGSGRNSRRK